MASLRRLGNVTGRKPMSQNEFTAQTQHTSKTPPKSLAAGPVLITLVAAGMIAGETCIAFAATSLSASPAAPSAICARARCASSSATTLP
jgi:hypothetical protein